MESWKNEKFTAPTLKPTPILPKKPFEERSKPKEETPKTPTTPPAFPAFLKAQQKEKVKPPPPVPKRKTLPGSVSIQADEKSNQDSNVDKSESTAPSTSKKSPPPIPSRVKLPVTIKEVSLPKRKKGVKKNTLEVCHILCLG